MSIRLNVEMLNIINTKFTKLALKLSEYNSFAYLFHFTSCKWAPACQGQVVHRTTGLAIS